MIAYWYSLPIIQEIHFKILNWVLKDYWKEEVIIEENPTKAKYDKEVENLWWTFKDLSLQEPLLEATASPFIDHFIATRITF